MTTATEQIRKDMDAIEGVLKQFGITPGTVYRDKPCRVTPENGGLIYSSTGNFVEFVISTPDKHAKVHGLENELNQALTFSRDRRPTYVTFTEPILGVRFPHPSPETLEWDMVPSHLEPYQYVVGRDYTAQRPVPMVMSLEDGPTPHLLITGTTGAGKSVITANAICTLVTHTAPQQLALLVIAIKPDRDPDMKLLNGLPHMIRSIVTDAQEGMTWLRKVMALKEWRMKHGWDGKIRLVVNIQELSELGGTVDDKTEMLAILASILQVGRSLGIHVLADTQYPTVDVVGKQGKANFPAMVVAMLANQQVNATVCGGWGIEAHKLPGRGACYVLKGGKVFYCQSHNLQNEMLRAIVSQANVLYPNPTTLVLPEVGQDDYTGENDLDKVLALYTVDELVQDGKLVNGAIAKAGRAIYGEEFDSGGAGFYRVKKILGGLK